MSDTRLQVLLSRAGVASRRAAERMIRQGRVTVNGEVVTEMGSRANPHRDRIELDGEPVGDAQAPATIVMHKPVRVVTTRDDPEGRETVTHIVDGEPFRFLPVGRLDYHTEGLLLLTTDGELTNRLLHPKYHVPKVYMVKVRGAVKRSAIDQLRQGVQLEDGATRPAVVEHKGQGTGHTWLEMVVTEGRNRLVRRMCDAIGHPALRVVRVEMGTIKLEGLKPGQYRYLEGEEINALYRVAKMPTTPAQPEHAELTGYRVLGESRRGRGPMPGQDILPDGFVAKVSRRERAAQEQGQLRAEAKRERRQARQARHGGPKQEDRPAPTERLGRHDFQPRTEKRSEHRAGRGPRSGGNEWKPRDDHRGSRSSANEWKPREDHRGPRSGGNEWKPREDHRGPRPGGNEWKPREDQRGPRSGGNEWKPRGEHGGRGPRSGGNEWKPRDGDRPVHRRFGQPQDDRGPGRTHGREDNRGGPRGRDRDNNRGGSWQGGRDDNRGGPRGRDRDDNRGGPRGRDRDDNRGGPRGRDRDDNRGGPRGRDRDGPWQRDRDDDRGGPRRFGRDDPRGSTRRFGRDPNRNSGADRDRDEDGRPQRSWQQRGPGAPRGRTDGNRKGGGPAPQRDGGRGQGPKGNGARFDATDTKAKGKSPRPRTDPKKSKKKKRK